jgi:hypothetical protein
MPPPRDRPIHFDARDARDSGKPSTRSNEIHRSDAPIRAASARALLAREPPVRLEPMPQAVVKLTVFSDVL